MKPAELRMCVLYPDRLNLYADRGNLMVLSRRCQWRGMSCRITPVGIGEALATDADLYYLGGGSDRDMASCARDLAATKRDALVGARERGALILGVCGGFQLLGHEYRTATMTMEGLGLVDLWTERSDEPRLVGNIVVEADIGPTPRTLVGFENHAGRTYLGDEERALGSVREGHGNNGEDGREGVMHDNVIGTYLHGPLLAKNAWFADWLIASALHLDELSPLDDALEELVHHRAHAMAIPRK